MHRITRSVSNRYRCVLLSLFAVSLVFGGMATTPVQARDQQDDKRMVGYFIEWGIYGRNYRVQNIATSGSAAHLTHINYAFGNVAPDPAAPDQQVTCQIGDAWADYQKPWAAEESVDGVAVGWDAPLRGNFQQLKALKASYPDLKVLIALGGWTWSSHFSNAALTAESRAAFVKSCVDLFIKGDLPAGDAGGPGAAAGVFDGIDIDWEYPGVCGLTCGDEVARPEDTRNFTLLLQEFRRQLDALGQQHNKHYALTIASSASPNTLAKLELNTIHQYLDFINVMTYDFHGTWEKTTNFNSPLLPSHKDPTRALGLTTAESIRLYVKGGVPRAKLVVGVPFYGRGWQGVPATNNGLYQTSSGATPGTYEAGMDDYKVLKARLESGSFTRHFDGKTRNAWLYNATTGVFWTYDDDKVMQEKAKFVNHEDLGGVMFWELSGDTADGELVKALGNTLK